MANSNALTRIISENDLERAVERSFSEPVVLLKHSATCPVSAWAREEMLLFARSEQYPVYEVVVQTARPLSNAIADRYSIRHESPQAIILYRGEPVFNASHRRVTALTIREAAQQAGSRDLEPVPALPA